jgi:hypothetical protein
VGAGGAGGNAAGGAIYSLGYTRNAATGSAAGNIELAGSIAAGSSIAASGTPVDDVVLNAPANVADGNANVATDQVTTVRPTLVFAVAAAGSANINAGPLTTGVDPQLSPFLDIETPNQPATIALLPGSPAAAATPCLDAAGLAVGVDARGLLRSSSWCSMGAWDDVIFADPFGD